MTRPNISEIKARCEVAAVGPWKLCYHLQSEVNDKKCPCGFAGDIWSADGETVVCSIGVPHIDESSEMVPRYERSVELANAALIANAPKDIPALIAYISELEMELDQYKDPSFCTVCNSCGVEGCCSLQKCKFSPTDNEIINSLNEENAGLRQDLKDLKEKTPFSVAKKVAPNSVFGRTLSSFMALPSEGHFKVTVEVLNERE